MNSLKDGALAGVANKAAPGSTSLDAATLAQGILDAATASGGASYVQDALSSHATTAAEVAAALKQLVASAVAYVQSQEALSPDQALGELFFAGILTMGAEMICFQTSYRVAQLLASLPAPIVVSVLAAAPPGSADPIVDTASLEVTLSASQMVASDSKPAAAIVEAMAATSSSAAQVGTALAAVASSSNLGFTAGPLLEAVPPAALAQTLLALVPVNASAVGHILARASPAVTAQTLAAMAPAGEWNAAVCAAELLSQNVLALPQAVVAAQGQWPQLLLLSLLAPLALADINIKAALAAARK